MVSVDHSSPPSPPLTIILCPKNKDDDPHHILTSCSWSKNQVHEKKRLLCTRCKHETIVCDYWCDKCNLAYHKECVKCPPEIKKVPYHPKHPLKLSKTRLSIKSPNMRWSIMPKNCYCCGEYIEGKSYSCSKCDVYLHTFCAIKPNILSINNSKRHEHTLTYFPRKSSLTCDVCAVGDDKCCIYFCYQCDFIVHKSCIYLPSTIRISRHEHRLSFTPSLSLSVPNKEWFCGVCRKRVDENYGEYSCVKGCNYVVHSKCATRRDLWDGKELEGEPDVAYENVKMFKEIGDGIIEHFSHLNHYMRLDKEVEDGLYDEKKYCQACILPIYEGNIYNCMKCDFILHETCAHLPRRKWHQLHAHPLTLQVDPKVGLFYCGACRENGFGFSYACCEPNCDFELDVQCALVSEPFFIHQLHSHPLLFTFEQNNYNTCSFCREDMPTTLTCIECKFDLCLRCATIPNKVKYIYDEHFLTRFRSEEIVPIYCEICEKLTHSNGFYECKVCCVTLHIECLLGKYRFMKPAGEGITISGFKFLIIPNNRLTRPICSECERHSPYRVAFIITSYGMLFCSPECIPSGGIIRLRQLADRRKGKDTVSWWRQRMETDTYTAALSETNIDRLDQLQLSYRNN